MAKLWGGRFDKPPSEELFDFLSAEDSLLDSKLAVYDIQGSLAHVCMLSKQKILPKKEAAEILSALMQLYGKAQEGKFTVDPKLEDVHTNVEAAVTKITPHGMKMHTARSRNDQVSLDTRLYMRDAVNSLSEGLLSLQASLSQLAKNDCVFPSYTHFQVAQPVSVAFWAHAHYQEFERDLQRLSQLYGRANLNPLGSGAVAGTAWPIDREYTSGLLGFDGPTANPMDTVSARGELEAELLSCLVLAMVHCSKIAEDIILLSNKRLILLPDEYSTGSSMMPQKKNPDPLELIRGKASRMLGLHVMVSSLIKGLPSGYNKDTQESKFAMISGVETALAAFSILSKIIPKLKFDEAAIKEELEQGFACATELADLMAQKGVPFRKAHEITGQLVKARIANKKFLSQLSADEISGLSGVKISRQELDGATCVDKVARYAAKYKFAASDYADALAKRKASLEKAHAMLLRDVKSITG